MQIDPCVLLKCCFQLFKPGATENVSELLVMHVDFCTDIMSLMQNYHNNFKQPVRSFRIRLHTDKAAFISPWVDGSLHLWVTVSELCGIHHVYLFLFSRLRSSYTSDVFFWKIFSRECDYLCVALSFLDLYPSASASLSIGISSQTVLFTRVSHSHSLFCCASS